MILGDTCTRNCGFCAVRHGAPSPPDREEPLRIAQAAVSMGLDYVVLTSVTRDDLPDGGATAWASTIEAVRQANPRCKIEVLVPDFAGKEDSILTVLAARPDVFGHNMETVPRLYPAVRSHAVFERSLRVLQTAGQRGFPVKTGLMLGLGESDEDLNELLVRLEKIKTSILTLGQYLQPTRHHLPVRRYVSPEDFNIWRDRALSMGFKEVFAGPLVRSSYHAGEHAEKFLQNLPPRARSEFDGKI